MPCPSKLEGGWWWVVGPIISICFHFAFCPPTTWLSEAPGSTGNWGPKGVNIIQSTERRNIFIFKFFTYFNFWRICCETFYPLEKFDVKFVTVQTNFLGPNLTQFLLLENTSEAVRSRSDGLIQILLLRKFWACIDRDYTPPCVLLGYFDTEKGSRSILEKLILTEKLAGSKNLPKMKDMYSIVIVATVKKSSCLMPPADIQSQDINL